MREWLPSDHLVWFVLDTVEVLDTGALDRFRRVGGAGTAGYDPRMLLALLVYAYCRGVRSSRQVERLCTTDVAFRVLCAQDVPDHCTIARFRAECQDAFIDLFAQVLLIAGRAGLARFGTVAIDGTKIAANASIDANRSHEWLSAKVEEMVTQAEQVDAAEDAAGQGGDRADRVPPGLGNRTSRADRIRQAANEITAEREQRTQTDTKAATERNAAALARLRRWEAGEPVLGPIPKGPYRVAEAQAHLARQVAAHQARLDRYAGLIAAGTTPMGRPPLPMDRHARVLRARRAVQAAQAAEQAAARAAQQAAQQAAERAAEAAAAAKHEHAKKVANTTDPQSRLMPTRKGFIQGYNAQVAVTADQVIVAVQVGQSTNDFASLVPMMDAAQQAATDLHAATGRDEHIIGTVLADAGYCSEANLAAPGPDRLIALRNRRTQSRAAQDTPATGPPPTDATPRQAMSHRLRTSEGQNLYKRRGATVEPGIGNLKKIIDRFSRRGLDNATSELHLAASAFNLMKLHRALAT
jgi:transposase